jgi:hypothetical protein
MALIERNDMIEQIPAATCPALGDSVLPGSARLQSFANLLVTSCLQSAARCHFSPQLNLQGNSPVLRILGLTSLMGSDLIFLHQYTWGHARRLQLGRLTSGASSFPYGLLGHSERALSGKGCDHAKYSLEGRLAREGRLIEEGEENG